VGDVAAEGIKRGSPFYMAPELFDGHDHSFASDLWALGCVLYELACGNPPFPASNAADIPYLIKMTELQKLEGYSGQFNDLLTKLLCKDREKRCSWAELLAHAWWGESFELKPPEGVKVASRKKPRETFSKKEQQDNDS
jgi:serine/threonine-protein kinase ULK4